MDNKLTKSEEKLIKSMRSLKYGETQTPEYAEKDKNNGIIIAYLTAHQFECADEMLAVVEKNKDKTFQEVMEALKNEGFFPEPEIVDDDELDDDEK
ncbi:MAG: hypothetical protein GXY08_01720 [Ruminococcus sp.]|nr:hypothetical protein [Ruminococcus sp.]